MTYRLQFVSKAQKEWGKLGQTLKEQFKHKLAERLKNPNVPKAKLDGPYNLYKIKLRQSGYRMIYQVREEEVIVLILKIGKRNKSAVYQNIEDRLREFL